MAEPDDDDARPEDLSDSDLYSDYDWDFHIYEADASDHVSDGPAADIGHSNSSDAANVDHSSDNDSVNGDCLSDENAAGHGDHSSNDDAAAHDYHNYSSAGDVAHGDHNNNGNAAHGDHSSDSNGVDGDYSSASGASDEDNCSNGDASDSHISDNDLDDAQSSDQSSGICLVNGIPVRKRDMQKTEYISDGEGNTFVIDKYDSEPSDATPRISVRGLFWTSNLRKLQRLRKRKTLWKSVSSANDGPTETEVQLKTGLWNKLPEELLLMILVRLPTADQFRFRCVCLRWKVLLSSHTEFLRCFPRARRPFCTIKQKVGCQFIKTFCHADGSWFKLRCNVFEGAEGPWNLMPGATRAKAASLVPDLHWAVRMQWTLVDVDEGHLCYTCCHGGCHWMAVSNPMIPGSILFLPPYHSTDVQDFFIKLLIDRSRKTFRVVMLLPHGTAVFDSVSIEWMLVENPFEGKHHLCRRRFVRKDFLYVYVRAPHHCLFVLDTVTKTWSRVDVKFPCTTWKMTYIVGSEHHVFLVQVNFREDEFIRVWKLSIISAEMEGSFLVATWEKISVALPRSIKALAPDFRDCTSSGGEFLCFSGSYSYFWIKYNFATRLWDARPWKGEAAPEPWWSDWEATLEFDLKSEHFSRWDR